jgi:hypothetical protein
VAVGDQPAHRLRSDQPESACDKHLFGHCPPMRGRPAATDMPFSKNESSICRADAEVWERWRRQSWQQDDRRKLEGEA